MNCYILAFFNRVCYQISMGLFNLSLERVSVKIPWGIKPRYSEQNYLPLKGKETKATLFHLVLFRPLSLSVRMIDLSIGDKKLFSIMRLLPPPSHFPWAIIAGLSERPMITTGLGHKGKSISARGSRWRTVHVCVCVHQCILPFQQLICRCYQSTNLHKHFHAIRNINRSASYIWINTLYCNVLQY